MLEVDWGIVLSCSFTASKPQPLQQHLPALTCTVCVWKWHVEALAFSAANHLGRPNKLQNAISEATSTSSAINYP